MRENNIKSGKFVTLDCKYFNNGLDLDESMKFLPLVQDKSWIKC